jgi:HPt (histidine-containing phosphotransfer) domain-containing protein
VTSAGKDEKLPSPSPVQSEIDELLLSGRASTMAEAERMFLDVHLDEIAVLASQLTDEQFDRHELVRLLLAHGSRPWEDSSL